MTEKKEGEFGRLEGPIPNELETADEEALQRIPGIGVKRAAAIVEMRNEDGGITMERLVILGSGCLGPIVSRWSDQREVSKGGT